jgi:lysophospholipase L1-like esterase
MKKIFFSVFIALGLLLSYFDGNAQAFQKEVDAFIKADNANMPAEGGILFVGSSSFTKWVDIKEYFPGYPIINRGFGGSSLPDVIYHASNVITKYKPKQIYIYCGENDIAGNDAVTADTVLNRFKQLYSIIRKNLNKKTNIVFVSIKPSVSRWKLEQKFNEANAVIKNFIESERNIIFLDVHTAMLESDGMVKKNIFIQDQLHMNAAGYKIWQAIIAPTLLKK